MRARLVLICAAALTALAACGIPADDEPRVVQPPPGPYQALGSQPPPSRPTGAVVETLYFVRDGAIVAVMRRVDAEPTVEAVVHDLLAGPTDTERAAGLGSSFPGAAVIDGVVAENGLAVVALGGRPEETGRNDEILAYGQIVCTLDARPEIVGVTFQYQGEAVGVPRGDGSLSTGPLTSTDYQELVGPR